MTASILSLPPLRRGHVADLDAWFPEPEELVARCRETTTHIAELPAALRSSLAVMGAPPWELAASPYSTRVAALAASEGIVFAHHERRHALRRAEQTQGEVRGVAAFDSDTGWEDGVFVAPKYGAFTLEERLACRDPNLRPKWRPHELLHRLVGFYWHPEMTRFEAYVGARIGELLPVVHWYGFDEIFRGRCASHASSQRYRVHCPACEQAAREQVMQDARPDAAARDAALWFATFGRAHLAEEVGAVLEELRTGRRVETFRPRLNASSDAVGYLRAHWNRMTSWGMGAWIELFLAPERDYSSSAQSLLERLAAVSAAMVAGECELDARAGARRRERRILQDLGMRAFIAIERAGESMEDAAMPVLERLGERARSENDPSDDLLNPDITNDLRELFAILNSGSGGIGARVFCAGLERSADAGETAQAATQAWLTAHVAEGLRSGLPDLAEDVEAAALEAEVREFVVAPAFDGEASLRARFCGWLRGRAHPWAERAGLEHLVRRRPHRDEQAELFGAVPESSGLGRGHLRMNCTARTGAFSGAAVAQVLGWEPNRGADRVDVVVAWFDGSARAMVATAQVRELMAAVREQRWDGIGDPALLVELVSQGIVAWFPRLDSEEGT